MTLVMMSSIASMHCIKSTAGDCWAAVQRPQSLLQCGNTVNLQLHLLHAVLVPVLQCGCQIWGVYGARVTAANHARADLQRLYDHYITTIRDLLPSRLSRQWLI